MINVNDSLYDLKNEVDEIEFEYLNAMYQFNSIPKRKMITAQKLFIDGLGILLILVIVIGNINKLSDLGKDGEVLMIALPVFSLFLVVMEIILIIHTINDLKPFIGTRRKTENLGFSNYSMEEKYMEQSIKDLLDRKNKLEFKIAELKKHPEYRDNTVKCSFDKKTIYEMTRDEFVHYAFGKYGEEEVNIKHKIEYGIFEKEREELKGKIENQKRHISNLACEKAYNEEMVDEAKNVGMILGVIWILVCFVYAVICEKWQGAIIGGIVAIIYTVGAVEYIKRKYKDCILMYLLDNKYDKIKTYAYDHNLVRSSEKKNEALKIIKENKERLEYVEYAMTLFGKENSDLIKKL